MPRPGPAFIALALFAQISLGQVTPAFAQSTAPSAAADHSAVHRDWRPIVLGLGAIAGVLLFNVVALGVEAVPGGFAYEAGDTVPAEMSVAMSRVYATSAAVAGGLLAYYALAR